MKKSDFRVGSYHLVKSASGKKIGVVATAVKNEGLLCNPAIPWSELPAGLHREDGLQTSPLPTGPPDLAENRLYGGMKGLVFDITMKFEIPFSHVLDDGIIADLGWWSSIYQKGGMSTMRHVFAVVGCIKKLRDGKQSLQPLRVTVAALIIGKRREASIMFAMREGKSPA